MNLSTAKDIYDDMMDDLSVQTLLMDIKCRMDDLGWSLEKVKENIIILEDEAQTELTKEEREALFIVLSNK